jgi:predicted DNA-binding protein with PD1-like motif
LGTKTTLHYFESHSIHVVTSFGLGEIIGSHLTRGRIAKWALELMGLEITYVSQTVIKSLALADFEAEWTKTQQPHPQSLKSIEACTLMALSHSTVSGEA